MQYSHTKPKLVFLAITIEANAQEVVVNTTKKHLGNLKSGSSQYIVLLHIPDCVSIIV